MKNYLCGGITGIENNNLEEFRRVAELLKEKSIDVIVPHDLFEGMDTSQFSHQDYMDICITHMATCKRVITLQGWENSIGANQEVKIARLMNKEVVSALSLLPESAKRI